MAEWQPIETAPKDVEVILAVEYRAGIRHGVLVGHYMEGGHCIEDQPAIDRGWYFWNGCMFDKAAKPTHWMAMPHHPQWGSGWQALAQGSTPEKAEGGKEGNDDVPATPRGQFLCSACGGTREITLRGTDTREPCPQCTDGVKAVAPAQRLTTEAILTILAAVPDIGDQAAREITIARLIERAMRDGVALPAPLPGEEFIGWKPVPITPTRAMLDAAYQRFVGAVPSLVGFNARELAYKALLDAAPPYGVKGADEPSSREAIIRAAVAAMPNCNPGVADDLLEGHTMHMEADDLLAVWRTAANTKPPEDTMGSGEGGA